MGTPTNIQMFDRSVTETWGNKMMFSTIVATDSKMVIAVVLFQTIRKAA